MMREVFGVIERGSVSGDEVVRRGRRRDPSRDPEILGATLEVLAEFGYEGLTMDAVAARAKAGKATLYRRWSSKEEMVLDAVSRMKKSHVDIGGLPDTGTLRGDLLGLFRPQSVEEQEHRLRVMAGLSSMLSKHRSLAEEGSAAIVEPWAEAYRVLIRRAVERGEVSEAADVETAAQIVPSMAAYRALIQHRPFEREFLVSLIDGVLLPALRYRPEQTEEQTRQDQ